MAKLYGVYRFTETANMANAYVEWSPGFRCLNRSYNYMTFSGSSPNKKLYYCLDPDNLSGTGILVWDENGGNGVWLKDCYRVIAYNGGDAETVLFDAWLDANCDVKGLRDISRTSWVFDDVIDYPGGVSWDFNFNAWNRGESDAIYSGIKYTVGSNTIEYKSSSGDYYTAFYNNGWYESRHGQAISIPSGSNPSSYDMIAFLLAVASNHVHVEYDNQVIARLSKGQNATIHCKDLRMGHNLIVRSPSDCPCRIDYGGTVMADGSGKITIGCQSDNWVMKYDVNVKTNY